MHGLAVLLFPAVLMLFALAMERLENQLERLNVRPNDVEEFLESAQPEQMDTLARSGFPAALDEFRDRRIPTTVETEHSIRAS
ncbi:hypothetical protein KXR83_21785 [Williamsia muralis]|uniref:hypothetical protein n=1 Tax=Williamsia marianensis TaxID=85044 RepID=UPI003F17421D